ncbi:UNVERIFIED_CONTAM: hypothetical protein HHA_239050 [Hammondia hammondi]|eukprot:XP_008887514.1 hypothetical protein HHA_239050 [Hammondia hammondi]
MPSRASAHSIPSLSFLPQTPEPLGNSGTLFFYRPGPAPVSCRTSHRHTEMKALSREAGHRPCMRLRARALFEEDAAGSPLYAAAEDAGKQAHQTEEETEEEEGEEGEEEQDEEEEDEEGERGRRGTARVSSFNKSSRKTAGHPRNEDDENGKLKFPLGPCLLRSRQGVPATRADSCSSVCTPGPHAGTDADFLCDCSTKNATGFSPFPPQLVQSSSVLPSSSASSSSSSASSSSSSSFSREGQHSQAADDFVAFQRVRLQLLSLQYTEKFDPVNTRLVDRLLQDVVKAVENFQVLMKKFKDLQSQLLKEREAAALVESARMRSEEEAKKAQERLRDAERAHEEREEKWRREKRDKQQTAETLRGLLAQAREQVLKTEEKLKKQEEQNRHLKRMQGASRSPSLPRRSPSGRLAPLRSGTRTLSPPDSREATEAQSTHCSPRKEEREDREGREERDECLSDQVRHYRQLVESLREQLEAERLRGRVNGDAEAGVHPVEREAFWEAQLRQKEEECRVVRARVDSLSALCQELERRAGGRGPSTSLCSEARGRRRRVADARDNSSESSAAAQFPWPRRRGEKKGAKPRGRTRTPRSVARENDEAATSGDSEEEREEGEEEGDGRKASTNEAKDLVEEVENDVADLVAELEHLQRRRRQDAKELSGCRAAAREATRQARDRADEELADLSVTVKQMEEQLAEEKRRRAALEAELEAARCGQREPADVQEGEVSRLRWEQTVGLLERERSRSLQKDFLIQQLEGALTEVSDEVRGIVERKEALEEAVEAKEKRASEMGEKAETLERRVQELETAFLKLEAQPCPATSLTSGQPRLSSSSPEEGLLHAQIADRDAQVSELEQQVARLSQLLAAVEQNRGEELQVLTEQLAASRSQVKNLESAATGKEKTEALWRGYQLQQLREELFLSDREKDSLHRELAVKEEAEAALQELVKIREEETTRLLADFTKSRQAASAEREALTTRAEEMERHLQELRVERDLLQQRTAVLQSDLETLGRLSEENSCLVDEMQCMQRRRDELEEQLRLQRVAHEQVVKELQELQKRHEHTMALCSQLTVERSEAVEATEAHRRRTVELESELSLMAERQHQILQDLATTQRAQKRAEEDYFLLLQKMEELTEQIASAHADKMPSPCPSALTTTV